jgi:FdhD protein
MTSAKAPDDPDDSAPISANEGVSFHPGALPYPYWVVQDGHATYHAGGVIEETLVTIFVNGQEIATVMCSPLDQEALALGFLLNEGVISSLAEVALVRANLPRTGVDVILTRRDFDQPRRMVLTSGCGGGITLQHLTEAHPALDSDLVLAPAVILARMKDLHGAAKLYNQVRGVHTSILGNAERLLLCAEDVGRHNTIDKIAGHALQAGIDTRDCLLISSGRISSEMLGKARRMGVPIVASRTAPTSIAVRLAQAWNICVIGYVRQHRMQVYTHPQRLSTTP